MVWIIAVAGASKKGVSGGSDTQGDLMIKEEQNGTEEDGYAGC